MKVWHITPDVGYGGNLLYNLTNNAKRIPKPLPWIDPSINCLYKEAVLSFMVGNYESCITNLCLDVHDALEEALANALAHANYYGRRGILVVKKGKELSISNPGTIRVTKEEFYAGGNSDPRNPNILKMFGFVNVGERAGSGVDKIMTAWAEQNWKKPEFDFSERSDRVTLKLEVGQVVYIPGAADIRNENTNQAKAMAVSKEDKILEYIRQNGSISSQKAADIGGYKSKTGARKLLDKMIEKGLITKIGNGPATKYVI